MKNFLLKETVFLCVGMMLTACGSSSPSASDVLNGYRDWASTQEKLGQPARPLPPEAIVDHCKKDIDPPLDKGEFFNCFIRFGGENDPILNPVKMYRSGNGRWVHW
jgi:hypothetical protein